MKTTINPVSTTNRIIILDALRGFAIFGILMVNMQLFYSPVSQILLGYMGSESMLDKASLIFIKVLFEGKFYVIFSMLFGYGFWLFINRSTGNGGSIVPLFRRRVFFLLLIGFAHVAFLWAGDILIWYAMLGFVLILFKKVSDRGLIKWALGFILVPTSIVLFFSVLGALVLSGEQSSAQDNPFMMIAMRIHEKALVVYASGSFAEIMRIRLSEYALMLPGVFFFYPVVLGMFLMGVWAARKNIFDGTSEHLAFFRKLLKWAAVPGILFSIAYGWGFVSTTPGQQDMVAAIVSVSHVFSGVLLGATYISIIVLLVEAGKLRWFTTHIAPVGRMALTNYLLHSIICTTIFFSYGFGLFGKFNYWQGILLAIIIYALQIPFSSFWLKRFHYGPFEWLWRSLTYGKLQPFRKT